MNLSGRNWAVLLLLVVIVIAAVLGGFYYQQTKKRITSIEKEPGTEEELQPNEEPIIEEKTQPEEEPVDKDPPIILQMKWEPTKVINDARARSVLITLSFPLYSTFHKRVLLISSSYTIIINTARANREG